MQRLSQPAAPCVQQYVWALGLLAAEVSRDLRLLPTYLGVVALVPQAILKLREERRLAA
jgi:hypothetical protein